MSSVVNRTEPNQVLARSDIVGKTVRRVYRSDWNEDDDGYAGCTVFVELADGIVFELQGVDFGAVEPIRRLDPRATRLIPVDKRLGKQCSGRVVVEVLASDQWCAIGLLLSGGKLLLISDDCTPRRVGPCVLDVGTVYKDGDYVPYWSQSG